ncbi:BON domain-containing protein [Castellaniella sp.]|uniref:BON domain-containing protein n=1 Tax=Castellaniella sp. TaxID=1955812 RepID=UPI003566965C
MSYFVLHSMRAAAALLALSLLAGCAAVVVGGATTTAVVASDRRSTGEQVDDQTIELRADSELEQAFGDQARISIMSYAGRVLLVGDIPTEADKQKAIDIVRDIFRVKSVDNFLRVGAITPFSVRSNDAWITSKVKSQLIATKDVPFRTIKVMTERGTVYLMGKVTAPEGERAAKAASAVGGVNKVVKLFDIVTPEVLSEEYADTPPTAASSSAADPGDPETQTLPVK